MAMLSIYTSSDIIHNGLTILMNLNRALLAAEAYQTWLAGQSVASLTAAQPNGPGMDANDAQDLLDAFADANGLKQLAYTGTDSRPGTNPGATYKYMGSIIATLGPQVAL
ncbi:MAG TPA: hypothetical protein VGI66_03575 [Streptosporangiaceae bacterium]|jgi:hypothetical protein